MGGYLERGGLQGAAVGEGQGPRCVGHGLVQGLRSNAAGGQRALTLKRCLSPHGVIWCMGFCFLFFWGRGVAAASPPRRLPRAGEAAHTTLAIIAHGHGHGHWALAHLQVERGLLLAHAARQEVDAGDCGRDGAHHGAHGVRRNVLGRGHGGVQACGREGQPWRVRRGTHVYLFECRLRRTAGPRHPGFVPTPCWRLQRACRVAVGLGLLRHGTLIVGSRA